MLNIILTFIGTTIFGFIGKFVEEREKTKREELRNKTQIEIAQIESKNSSATRRTRFKEMLEKHIFELNKIYNKPTGNKKVDTVKGLMPPFITAFITIWAMGMITWFAISRPELIEILCEWFLFIMTAIIGIWSGGKIPTKFMPSIPMIRRK